MHIAALDHMFSWSAACLASILVIVLQGRVKHNTKSIISFQLNGQCGQCNIESINLMMLTCIHIDDSIGIDVWIDTLANDVHASARCLSAIQTPDRGVRCLNSRQIVCVQTTVRPLVCQTNEARLPVISTPAFASLCFLYGHAYGKRCHKRKRSVTLWGTWLHALRQAADKVVELSRRWRRLDQSA